MKNLILIIITLMIGTIFSEPSVMQWEVDNYYFCKYDSISSKYNVDCEESNKVVNVTIRRHLDTISINASTHLIDSLYWDVNSTGDSIVCFITKSLKDNLETIIVLSNTYINMAIPNKWKLSMTKAEEPTLVTGSSFGVGGKYLITNYHVVGKMDQIYIRVNEKYVKAKLVNYMKDLDIALIKADIPVNSCYIYKENLNLGQDIMAFGYPHSDIQGKSIKVTKGIISSNFGYQDAVDSYQIDAAVQSGNSGGPICKGSNVVGMVSSYLNIDNIQNVNYAIKSVFLIAFLKSMDVQLKGNAHPSKCTYLLSGYKTNN
jgi:S1-C subfamily serine protease